MNAKNPDQEKARKLAEAAVNISKKFQDFIKILFETKREEINEAAKKFLEKEMGCSLEEYGFAINHGFRNLIQRSGNKITNLISIESLFFPKSLAAELMGLSPEDEEHISKEFKNYIEEFSINLLEEGSDEFLNKIGSSEENQQLKEAGLELFTSFKKMPSSVGPQYSLIAAGIGLKPIEKKVSLGENEEFQQFLKEIKIKW